jgi:hypothetical protein
VRASKIVSILHTELEEKDNIIGILLAQNERLTAAALATTNPVAAAQLRPRPEYKEKPDPIIPIGM